ncbi:MAG: 2-oxoacid:acceptor oxidoreductase family protein [Clostridia bacterium]
MNKLDLYLVGVGGQGVLTIADIIQLCAINQGIHCNYYPTKGMAQRGGFVKAQLRLGNAAGGPEISLMGADVALSMELSESLKAIDYVKPAGDLLVYGYRFLPTDVMLGKAPYPDEAYVHQAADAHGVRYTFVDPILLPQDAADNVFLLGAAQKHTAIGQMFSADALLSAILQRFPKNADRNRAAFSAGLAV